MRSTKPSTAPNEWALGTSPARPGITARYRMLRRRLPMEFALVVAINAVVWSCYGQERPSSTPSPSPASESAAKASEPQEPIRVFTEEVVIPIFVYDNNGRFDPTILYSRSRAGNEKAPRTLPTKYSNQPNRQTLNR